MSKRRKRPKTPKRTIPGAIGEKLRIAIRSIIREWRQLGRPLPVDPITSERPKGAQEYRVRGAESYEELQEKVVHLAGRVWQLKDGLIKWLAMRPDFTIAVHCRQTSSVYVGTGGQYAMRTVEETARLCIEALLCADLYNTHKHYDDCNRSGYQPYLGGVELDGRDVGLWGVYYDGARKIGDFTVANPVPVPYRIEVLSRNHPVTFGNALTVIGRAFAHWISLIRQMELLSPTSNVDKAILDDLAAIEVDIRQAKPFDQTEGVLNIDELSLEQRCLSRSDPAAFVSAVAQNPAYLRSTSPPSFPSINSTSIS
jgi:hypothetical protein